MPLRSQDMAKTTRKIASSLEAALAELSTARKAVKKLEPMARKVQNARAEVLRANTRVWQAAVAEYIKRVLWDANTSDLTVETRGGKHWLTTRHGEAALLLKVHERGYMDIMGDMSYTRKHGDEWATVIAAMTGPNKIGLWYTTADGRPHWMQLHAEDATRLQMQVRAADGTLTPVAPMQFAVPPDESKTKRS
jgi:hypothetical protein